MNQVKLVVCSGGSGVCCVGLSRLNGDLLPVLIMCRLVLCNMSHLFCTVKTKGALDKCARGMMRVAVVGGVFVSS